MDNLLGERSSVTAGGGVKEVVGVLIVMLTSEASSVVEETFAFESVGLEADCWLVGNPVIGEGGIVSFSWRLYDDPRPFHGMRGRW